MSNGNHRGYEVGGTSSSDTSSPSRTRVRRPYPPPKISSHESKTSLASRLGPIGSGSTKHINHMNHDGSTSTNTLSDATSEDQNVLAQHDFMVSFMVDARGGAMLGCRYNGVKMTIPPKSVPEPMRITCRYVKQENLLYPPTLNEGEELASRILQVGPVGAQLLGPVLIEVPHVASLRRGERETAILRCDSASGGKWVEHKQSKISEKLLKETVVTAVIETNMSSSVSSMTSSSPSRNHKSEKPLDPTRTVCIVTKDFPQYFAVISRSKQEIVSVGADGGILSPALMPRVKVFIPPKALTREVEIGISAMHIEDDIVEEILVQGGAVSPIVTIEPRRRKFHKPITVTIPLPERMPRHVNNGGSGGRARPTSALTPAAGKQHFLSGGSSIVSSRKTSIESLNKNLSAITSLTPPPPIGNADADSTTHHLTNNPDASSAPIATTLKLVCSMSANHNRACWEDVTDTTPLTFTSGGVQFTSVVSASFWAIDCPTWMSSDVMTLVDQLYKSATRVPYLARIHVYARNHTPNESVSLRMLCVTEPDRAEHCVELQEDYKELCQSEFIEIFDKTEITIKFSGNLNKVIQPHHTISDASGASDHVSHVASSTYGIDDDKFRDSNFRPFSDNRMGFVVRRRNDKNPYPKGRITIVAGLDKVIYEAKVDLTKFVKC